MDEPLYLFGGIIVDPTRVAEILPSPLKPYLFPQLPDLALLRLGFSSCRITTDRGSTTSFLVFLSCYVDGASVSTATGGKLTYPVQEFLFRIYVDEHNAADYLSVLGLPVELTDISHEITAVDSMSRETLTVSDGRGRVLLKASLLRETTPSAVLPPESKEETDLKIGWVFCGANDINALRLKVDYNNGGRGYPLIEGLIEVSSASPFFGAFGDVKYDMAAALQKYLGEQGKAMVVLDGGKSQFVHADLDGP